MFKIKEKDIIRFWSKVVKTKDCWNWTASLDSYGYGQIGINGRLVLSHRISYELSFGKIPKGISILHTCDNRRCIRPQHLYSGTQFDNMRDMVLRGRRADTRGEKNPHSKITSKEILKIRRLYAKGDTTHHKLADMFGLSYGYISYIIRRISWKHI